MSYKIKYLKYKNKYLDLKNQFGGSTGETAGETTREIAGEIAGETGERIQEMPQLCFGTGQFGFYERLPEAFSAGYRHIDGADRYAKTQEDYVQITGKSYFDMVKERIKLIPRNKLWITWKVDNLSLNHIQDIIKKLDCKYIDLLLYHGGCKIPSDEIIQQTKTREDLKKHGLTHLLDELNHHYVTSDELVSLDLIRYYGVSNCEDLSYLPDKNIFANQVQARPPKGNLSNRGDFNDFVDECNRLNIRIMLYGSTSSLLRNLTTTGFFTNNILLVNKYYLQKYIKDKKNVLIVSSITGTSININMEYYKKIMNGENLLSPEEMLLVESELEKYNLQHM
jgi:diketogulonate reductase-like aldo/keto reductase